MTGSRVEHSAGAGHTGHGAQTHDDGQSVSELFTPVPTAVRAVRQFVEHTLRAWDESDLVDEASVVVSELATNAVLHSSTPFRVSLAHHGAKVRLGVQDAGGDMPQPRVAGSDAVSGRGLAIVAAVSSSWGTELVPDGKVVWAELVGASSS